MSFCEYVTQLDNVFINFYKYNENIFFPYIINSV